MNNEFEDFKIDTRVNHEIYGKGIVKEVNEYEFLVQFDVLHPHLHNASSDRYPLNTCWRFYDETICELFIIDKKEMPNNDCSDIPASNVATKEELENLKDLLLEEGISCDCFAMKYLDDLLDIHAKERLLNFLEEILNEDDFYCAEIMIEDVIKEAE